MRLGARLGPATEAARGVGPSLGVHVRDVATGASIFDFRAERLRILASNTKLFTSGAALDLLGPGYLFETRVLARGPVAGTTLVGELAVLGGGDPNLSGRFFPEDPSGPFASWVEALRALGVTRITGDLLLVDGLFEGPEVHPDWSRDQLGKWYEAPVAALAFEDSALLVRVWPAARAGRPALVELVPPLDGISIENRAVTSSSGSGIEIIRPATGAVVRISGRIRVGEDPVESWVSVPDPVAHFGGGWQRALERGGVSLDGEPRRVAELTPGLWRPVYTHRTGLLETLEVLNKRSQNFYAECLVKLLGALRCGEGSWPAGLRAVREHLEEMGIAPDEVELADGSGMSRRNRATPEAVTAYLRAMYLHRHGREYLRSLPHSGEEGLRWRDRLAEEPYRGNVFAKTGTLAGVSTLSGYAKGRSGRIYAFSILMNDVADGWRAKGVQDGIVKVIVEEG